MKVEGGPAKVAALLGCPAGDRRSRTAVGRDAAEGEARLARSLQATLTARHGTEVIMVADPGIFRPVQHDTTATEEPALRHAARRAALVPVAEVADEEVPFLLDYGAFVLEQEAAYCQQ
jgi:hypothetical protein